jgi:cobyrinic acid a,c-diamide synthase
MHAFVVAGTHSGCGKTTVTLGLLAALAKKGLEVQSFKTGPDFIDSGLHKLATGRISRNLDLWMCGEAYVRSCFGRHVSDADVAVVEGVMGLYDGELSTASLASALGLPIVLVIDGYGMAESAGPIVKGFMDWGSASGAPNAAFAGVIFNRVASPRHYDRLVAGVRGVPVLGYLPRDLRFEIPHRHLGLVVAEEDPVSTENLDRLADTILEYVDVGRLLEATEAPALPALSPASFESSSNRSARPVRIAVASDRAFCFYYQDNLDLLRAFGAEIVPFSPLVDRELPGNVDGVYLGGGYPELYGAELSANVTMRRSLQKWAEKGGPVYGECGGFMYLCEGLRDFEDRFFEMTGIFPFRTEMVKGRAHLGYREVFLTRDCPLGAAGQTARGHEFHYSRISGGQDLSVGSVYRVKNGSGEDTGTEGYCVNNVLGSYIHIHFGSNLSIASGFIAFAVRAAKSRQGE